MKNQCFDDTRDLFKHDLVLEILSHPDLGTHDLVDMAALCSLERVPSSIEDKPVLSLVLS